MFYQLPLLVLFSTMVTSIPMEEFFPFNGEKVCLMDASVGLVYTNNTIDEFGVPITDLNPLDCNEFRLTPNDDASSQNISISFSLAFFNKRFKTLFINTNGVISFLNPVPTFTPEPFPIPRRFLIAPFWADVDTRGIGDIFFKETKDSVLLQRANEIVQRSTTQARGLSRFKPRWMLIATWYKVGYFSSHTDKTNTFQVLLITNGKHSFAIFNYLDDGINWNKGDASTVPAQVGFNFGEPNRIRNFTLIGSRTEDITNIELNSNVNNSGQFVYRIDKNPTDNEGCGANVTVDPETPSIINGDVMFLVGPCLSAAIENITCLFNDSEGDVTAYKDRMGTLQSTAIKGISKDRKAICPMPLFRTLGEHTLTIFVKDGNSYSGSFEVVSAHHKEPEIHISRGDQEKEFSLIEHDIPYNATWFAPKINADQFSEGGSIEFRLENWLWFLDSRWQRRMLSNTFKLDNPNYDEGVVTFNQTRSKSARINFDFDISILILNKQTKHLKIMYTSTLFSFMPKSSGTGATAVTSYCESWLMNTQTIVNSSKLNRCPCNLQTIRGDPDFVIDDTCSASQSLLKCHENVGAERCYLKQISEGNGGQQCCYNAEGIFTRSRRQPQGNISVAAPAGSADFYFPVNHYIKHQYADYFPYRACCIESNHAPFCDQYYNTRPIDNNTNDANDTGCTRTIGNRGNAVGNGDPHFITLDGKQYTFNGLGEYILLDANDGDFIIQIQTKQAVNQNGNAIKATVISVMAMKQKDKPTIQVQLDDIDGIEVLVESNTSDDGFRELDLEFAPSRLFDGGRVNADGELSRAFTFKNGLVVITKAANDILSFQLSIPELFFNKTKGLLGVWNGNSEDDFLRPDGTRISTDLDESIIFEEFGEKWRVGENDYLFIYEEDAPISTKDSTYIPLFVTPAVDPMTSALISETCGDNSECAYDIAITGNADVGRETLDEIEEHMLTINLTFPIVCNPPCQNEAPCVANDTCNCNTGFTGSTCDVTLIRCDTPCQNGGNCTGLELCSCPKDFYGPYCEIYNPCILSPCKESCLVGDAGYICQCKNNHILAADGINCIKCTRSNNPTWHVALCNASNNDTICSGTVINDQWVLTSAGCVCNNGSGIDSQSLSIRLGKTRTCSYSDAKELSFSVSKIHCYPNQATDALTTDVAAINLHAPIPVNVLQRSPPLCIKNTRNGKRYFLTGKNVEIFGWGKVGETIEKEATFQSTGNVVVGDIKECRKAFNRDVVKYHVSNGIVCTIANTTSACTGNYGSAVVARRRATMFFGGIVNKMTSVCGAQDSYLAHSKLYDKEVFEWIDIITDS